MSARRRVSTTWQHTPSASVFSMMARSASHDSSSASAGKSTVAVAREPPESMASAYTLAQFLACTSSIASMSGSVDTAAMSCPSCSTYVCVGAASM